MNIDYSNFTLPALQVVTHAAAAAQEMGRAFASPDYLLIGLLRNGSDAVLRSLAPAGVTEELILERLLDSVQDNPRSTCDPALSYRAELALLDAQNVAAEHGERHVTPERILESLLVETVLVDMGLSDVVSNNLGRIAAENNSPSPAPARDPGLLSELRSLAAKLAADKNPDYKDEWERGHDAGLQSAGRELSRILEGL